MQSALEAKGKIERRFGTMQNRLVAILAYEKVGNYAAAQIVLDRERERQNATVCRTTALSPNARWQQALLEKRTATRPCPLSTLLDLHLALHLQRRVNSDNQVDFLGRSWHIAPTKRSTVTLIHHPFRQFWVVTEPRPIHSMSGPKYSEITPSNRVSFCLHTKSLLLNSRRSRRGRKSVFGGVAFGMRE